jgi:hypothetical protein
MKYSKFLAVLLVAVLALCSQARAAMLSVSSFADIGYVNAGVVHDPILSSSNENMFSYYDYLVSGTLSPMTRLTLTLRATEVVGDVTIGGAIIPGTAVLTEVAKGALGTLPFVALSNVGTAVSPIYRLTIDNLAEVAQSFSGYFHALIIQNQGGIITVAAAATAVPLPPSVILFLTALLALAAFGARGKAFGRI